MTVRLPKGVKKAGAQAKKAQTAKPKSKPKTPQAKKITTLRGKVQDFRSLYGPLPKAGAAGGNASAKGALVAPWENYGTLPGTSVLKLGGEEEAGPKKAGGRRKKKARQTKRRKRDDGGRSRAGTKRKY